MNKECPYKTCENHEDCHSDNPDITKGCAPHIPMCWKCADGLFAEGTEGGRSVKIMKGCRVNPDISNYNDAEKMCPLMEEYHGSKV
jgi:hypothetical protein